MELTCCCQSGIESEDEEQMKADGLTGRSLTSSEKIHRLMEQLGAPASPPPSSLLPPSLSSFFSPDRNTNLLLSFSSCLQSGDQSAQIKLCSSRRGFMPEKYQKLHFLLLFSEFCLFI